MSGPLAQRSLKCRQLAKILAIAGEKCLQVAVLMRHLERSKERAAKPFLRRLFGSLACLLCS